MFILVSYLWFCVECLFVEDVVFVWVEVLFGSLLLFVLSSGVLVVLEVVEGEWVCVG